MIVRSWLELFDFSVCQKKRRRIISTFDSNLEYKIRWITTIKIQFLIKFSSVNERRKTTTSTTFDNFGSGSSNINTIILSKRRNTKMSYEWVSVCEDGAMCVVASRKCFYRKYLNLTKSFARWRIKCAMLGYWSGWVFEFHALYGCWVYEESVNSGKPRNRSSCAVTMTTTAAAVAAILNIHWRNIHRDPGRCAMKNFKVPHTNENMQFLIKKFFFRMEETFSAVIWFAAWRCVNDRKSIGCAAPFQVFEPHRKPLWFSMRRTQKCRNGLTIYTGVLCAKQRRSKHE